MTCTSCSDKPKGHSKGFPRAVVEINNPESLVLLRKVVVPASMGTEEDVPPTIGKYFNVLLQYEANGHIYLYSSDGIPTAIEANIPQEVLDRIEDLEIDVDLLETGLANETTAREAADSALSSSINSLSSSLSAETEAREQADAALEGSINNLTADLEEEATTRETADTALGSRIDTVADNLATETANRISADEGLQADITAEATDRQNADATLQNNITAEATARENGDAALNTAITSETTARQEADTNLQNQITQEAQARAAADTAINGAITAEATARQTADAGLQSQIDAITAGSDVKDIVGTKAELNNYDTSTLGDNDIVKVLQDESENNATTYYRWNAATQQFTLIGEEGPYYTKSQTDTLLNAKQNTLTAGSNVQIVNDTISATDTTYTAGTGLALNGTQFSVDTTTVATQSDLTAGLATKQDTLTAGTNIQINNNTISATDTTYSDFTGTDGTAAGTAGLVPAPGATDAGKFLKADGTWDIAGGSGPTVVQTTGTSTTDVMSQNAVTSMVFADPSERANIRIGNTGSMTGGTDYTIAIGKLAVADAATAASLGYYAKARGIGAIALGREAQTTIGNRGSIALGSYSNATQVGEMNIGSSATTHGYNNSNYRLLTGLYDPQSDHDAATKGYVDTAVAGAGGGVTELTSADYDWPTANPDGVALFNLPAGVYVSDDSTVKLYYSQNSYKTSGLVVVGEPNSNHYRTIFMAEWDGSGGQERCMKFVLVREETGAMLESRDVLVASNIINNLTTSLTDAPLSAAMGKSLKDLIDSLVVKNAGAPTTSTVGTVGQLLEDTTNGDLYICTDATNPYVWEEVGAGGGGGPTVVQTTGTSTTDVMSQNAVTSMVFADAGTNRKVQIGDRASAAANYSVALGYNSSVSAGASYGVGIAGGSVSKTGGIAIKGGAHGKNTIAIGNSTYVDGENSIALGVGATTSTKGVMSIETTNYSSTGGYNNSNYRLLTGLYDPQSDHDAATKGYVDTLVDGKQDELTAGTGITIEEESGALVISSTGGGATTLTNAEFNAIFGTSLTGGQ